MYAGIGMKEGFSFAEILFFIVGIFAIIAIAGTVIFISSTNIEDADYDSSASPIRLHNLKYSFVFKNCKSVF